MQQMYVYQLVDGSKFQSIVFLAVIATYCMNINITRNSTKYGST